MTTREFNYFVAKTSAKLAEGKVGFMADELRKELARATMDLCRPAYEDLEDAELLARAELRVARTTG